MKNAFGRCICYAIFFLGKNVFIMFPTFFKWAGHPRPLLFIFCHFKKKLQNLQQNNVKNVDTVYGDGI